MNSASWKNRYFSRISFARPEHQLSLQREHFSDLARFGVQYAGITIYVELESLPAHYYSTLC